MKTLNDKETELVLEVIEISDVENSFFYVEKDYVCSQLIISVENKKDMNDEEFYTISKDLEKYEALLLLLKYRAIPYETVELK